MASLTSKNVGSIVKIKENGAAVDYIVVHKGLPSSIYDKSCDGVWLLRKNVLPTAQYYDEGWTDDIGDYSCDNYWHDCDIKLWLQSYFFRTIDEAIRAKILKAKVPWWSYIDKALKTGSYGSESTVFLLSGYEIGFTSSSYSYLAGDGAKLDYFSDSYSRIARTDSGGAVNWWLRSSDTNGTTRNMLTNSAGNILSCYSETVNYIRPALILPHDMCVTENGYVTLNVAPTIASSKASGGSIGEVSGPFDFTYTADDENTGDVVTVKEYLDNVFQRSYTAAPGENNIFQATKDPGSFQKLLNGTHTIKIIAEDNLQNVCAPFTVTFNKQVRTTSITLAEPLPADDVIKAAVVSITGNIPQDAAFEVLVTNNALDENPVWEDMSREVWQSTNHVFENKTAANGFAFNFRVTASRGPSDEQGFISNIGGAFE